MLPQDARGFSLKPPRAGEKHDVLLYLGWSVSDIKAVLSCSSPTETDLTSPLTSPSAPTFSRLIERLTE